MVSISCLITTPIPIPIPIPIMHRKLMDDRQQAISYIEQYSDYRQHEEAEVYERSKAKVEQLVQKPEGQDAYNKVVEKLIARGQTQEDAMNQAASFLIQKMMDQDQNSRLKELDDTIQQWNNHLAMLEQRLAEIQQQLSMYGVN